MIFHVYETIQKVYCFRFDKPVMISPHTKYALRLKNHGGTTSNGDGGLASVKVGQFNGFLEIIVHRNILPDQRG